jgi:hypothetical protein
MTSSPKGKYDTICLPTRSMSDTVTRLDRRTNFMARLSQESKEEPNATGTDNIIDGLDLVTDEVAADLCAAPGDEMAAAMFSAEPLTEGDKEAVAREGTDESLFEHEDSKESLGVARMPTNVVMHSEANGVARMPKR